MTTQTTTLAEFLLARIAEDERGADLNENMGHLSRDEHRKALAECEAKRRIVARESARSYDGWRRGVDEHRLTFDQWEARWPSETLTILAQPYADHPEFREEWRA